jgi:hypothetical protein
VAALWGSGANTTRIGDDGQMPGYVAVEDLFKGRHFDREIVVLCVRWYLSFKLSFKDLVAMMGERGVGIPRSCGGFSATFQSSKSAGGATHGQLADRGGWTRPI